MKIIELLDAVQKVQRFQVNPQFEFLHKDEIINELRAFKSKIQANAFHEYKMQI